MLPSLAHRFMFCIFKFNCSGSWAFQPSHGMLGTVINIYPRLVGIYLELRVRGFIVTFFGIILPMLKITCIFTICIWGVWLWDLGVWSLRFLFVTVVVTCVVNVYVAIKITQYWLCWVHFCLNYVLWFELII